MKNLIKILFLSLLVSFCFSDVITYFDGGYVKYTNLGEMTVVSDQRIVIKDVEIKSTLDGKIHYTKPVLNSTSINSGGGLILLSGLLNLYIINVYEIDLNKLDELEKLNNISSGMLSLGGLLLLINSIDYFNQDFYIDCEKIIELSDDNGNIIDFECP